MEPNVFLGYIVWGIISVLNNFEDEQYPFKSDIDAPLNTLIDLTMSLKVIIVEG
jgi:hypothetical protein